VGHANVKNLSEFFIRRLYARGKLSLREAIEGAMAKGLTLNASEGPYDDEGMIGMGLEVCISWLWHEQKVIEPHEPTEAQKHALECLMDTSTEFEEVDYKALDSLKWKFAPGWRAKYPDLPILHYFEN
jgi:hypothetical protein